MVDMPPALISSPPIDRGIQGQRSIISRAHRLFLLIRIFSLYLWLLRAFEF